MKNTLVLVLSLVVFATPFLKGQDFIYQTFKDRRVINTQSVDPLPKRKLDFRISHRFGDIAGDNGGYETLFGLDNAEDILIGAEYGISDNVNIGFFRTKGSGTMPDGTAGLRQLYSGVLKWRFLRQQRSGGSPLTLTFVGVTSISGQKKTEGNESAISSFPRFANRFAYNAQLLIARKFSPGFSLQLIPAYTYRNLVPFGDVNGILSIGLATRIQLSKVFGIIADATFPLNGDRSTANGFYPPVGIGLEIDTGGHVFQINFTNAQAIMETDYIPYTTSDWASGEFRLGFTISRIFNL